VLGEGGVAGVQPPRVPGDQGQVQAHVRRIPT
jgi:hypothetical protein